MFLLRLSRVIRGHGRVAMDRCLIVASDVSVLKTNQMVNKERDGQTGWNFLSCFPSFVVSTGTKCLDVEIKCIGQ